MRTQILWQRLDLPGHEICTLESTERGWQLAGTALLAHHDLPCRLEYVIECDENWQTRSASIQGEIGGRSASLELTRDSSGEWREGGNVIPDVDGCVDVDMGFSPSTNLLPIRRLSLGVGSRANVRAAWVKFPELSVELLEQTYTRLDENRYLYESADGAFRRELLVSPHGFVLDYPDYWRMEAIRS